MSLRIEKKRGLEEVQNNFRTWRLDRPTRGRNRLIPEALWQEALGLLPEYTPGRICKALRLDQSTFKKRAHQGKETRPAKTRVGQVSPKPVSKQGQPTFTVTNVEELLATPNDNWSASIQRPDGCVLAIVSCGNGRFNDLISLFCSGGR